MNRTAHQLSDAFRYRDAPSLVNDNRFPKEAVSCTVAQDDDDQCSSNNSHETESLIAGCSGVCVQYLACKR